MSTAEPAIVRREGATLVVTINRPHDDNRIDRAAMVGIARALDEADADPAIRVVVVTGSPASFCAGGRIDGHPGGTVEQQLDFAAAFTRLQERMGRTRAPIVAAVEGHCTAGGMSLLAACDMAIAADDVEFAYPEVNFGLFPMLAMAVAKDGVPDKLAFDLFYTGRRFSAAEAKSLHLVNRVVPRADFASGLDELVGMLASKSATAIALGRKAFYAMNGMSQANRLDYAQTMLTTMIRAAGEKATP